MRVIALFGCILVSTVGCAAQPQDTDVRGSGFQPSEASDLDATRVSSEQKSSESPPFGSPDDKLDNNKRGAQSIPNEPESKPNENQPGILEIEPDNPIIEQPKNQNDSLSQAGVQHFNTFCAGCHGDFSQGDKADRSLGAIQAALAEVKEMQFLNSVVSRDQLQLIAEALADPYAVCEDTSMPIPSQLLILTNAEYRFSVLDGLGVSLGGSLGSEPPLDSILLAETSVEGFFRNSDAQQISPEHIEAYKQAADAIAKKYVSTSMPSRPLPSGENALLSIPGNELSGNAGRAQSDFWYLWSEGRVEWNLQMEGPGFYTLQTHLSQDRAGSEDALAEVFVNGQSLRQFRVSENPETGQIDEFSIELVQGQNNIELAFLNDYQGGGQDRNIRVHAFSLLATEPSQPQQSDHPACELQLNPDTDCLAAYIHFLASKLLRKPVSEQKVSSYIGLVQANQETFSSPGDIVGFLLRTILLSPHFLMHLNHDLYAGDSAPFKLSGRELAARLSSVLWSSLPDSELLELADSGQLFNPDILSGQVDRMLQNKKSERLVSHFWMQSLGVANLSERAIDLQAEPQVTEPLVRSAGQESLHFLNHLYTRNLPLNRLLDADFSFVNQTLANHYGLGESGLGQGLSRVELSGTGRKGFLSQLSPLLITSSPGRTTPVKRGQYVLTNLLCQPPPPPPEGINTELEEIPGNANPTLKERLAHHRTDAICASCHIKMDSIGFGLESFSSAGLIRRVYPDGQPVDSTGDLEGQSFDDYEQMIPLLLGGEDLMRCTTTRALSFVEAALPRRVDNCKVRNLSEPLSGETEGLKDVLKRVLTSEMFQWRRPR